MTGRAVVVPFFLLLAATAAWIGIARPAWIVGGAEGPRDGDRGPDPAAPPDGSPDAAAAGSTLAARGGTAGRTNPASGDLPPPVDLERVDRERDLHGTVVDGTDAPVAGADLRTVTYPFDRASILAIGRDHDAVEGPGTRSARDGTFAIRLRPGAVVALRVAAAGFAPVERPSSRAGERVRIVLRPGVSLVVQATTPNGAPAAKTEFRLERRGDPDSTAFRRSGATGADGLLRFDDLPPGVTASLELGASTWAWDEYDRRITLPASGESTVRVALDPGRTITGRVTDADTKAPIEGASVGMGWWIGRAATTDADGRYALPGWTGNGIRDVHVRAQGYGRGQANVGTATVVDFELSKGDEVVGRAVGPDGKPVSGAVVAAIGSHFRENEQAMSTADGTTAADGRFALTGLRRDLPHTLVVMAPGCGRTLLDFDPRGGGPGTIDLGDVLLPTGRTLFGRVLRQDGSPVTGAQLELQGANADRGRLRPGAAPRQDFGYGSREESTSGADGRFAFLDLSPGTYELDVWTPGMPSLKPTVRIGSDADPAPLELRFPAGRSIRVIVEDDDGKPVTWAYVFVEGGSGPHNTVASLDALGSTTLLVPDSISSVTVETWGGGGDDPRRFLASDREFPIDPKSSELRCVLKQGVSLAGRVVGPDGAGVAKAGLEITRGGEHVASERTDDDGRFDATVPREGPFVVRLDGSVGAWPKVADSGLTGVTVDVPAGATDVVVKAQPAARDRRQGVRVVDPDGRPVEGAKVVAHWAQQAGKSAEVVTDASGRAEISNLPDVPCSWEASPRSEAGDLLPSYGANVVPSSDVVEIAMRRGVRAHGRVIVPPAAAGQEIRLELTQGDQRRMTSVLAAGDPTFSVLLDPENGQSGSAVARVGPADAPTYVARLEGVRWSDGEIVLTVVPVK